MKTMNQELLINIAHKWFDAFNRQDLEALLALYDNNAEHYSPKLKLRQPETNGWIKGKDSLRSWWADAFERLPELRYAPNKIIANDDVIFMEYLRTVPNEENLIVGELLELHNGLIIRSKVFHS